MFVKRKIKGRPLSNSAFRPYPAAMAGYDALHCGEPDARAIEFIGAMQPLEGSEQLADIIHIKTRTVVTHKINWITLMPYNAELNLDMLFFSSKLPGITYQIV